MRSATGRQLEVTYPGRLRQNEVPLHAFQYALSRRYTDARFLQSNK